MSEIYLVLHCSGSYEDYYETPLKAFASKAKAQELVDAMNERKHRWDANRQTQIQLDKDWCNANPRPMAKKVYPKTLPSFSGPQKCWTAEQKEKLSQAKTWNRKAEEEFVEQNCAWHTAFMARQEEFLLGLSREERDDLSSFDSESNWSIEPIPYEE